MRRSGSWTAALPWAVVLAGLAFRLRDFGRYGFWNDEAWVALSTRVDGLGQFWLSLSTTPVLWAAALRPLALLPLAPEVSLRLLPLAFSCLTLWAAWSAGREIAGHLTGGLLAVAVVAFDPPSAEYAQQLKQYGAEAFFALLAVWQAARVVERGTRRALPALVAVLVVGLGFTNSQLLLGPPLLGALLLRALVRREWRDAGRIALAGVGVAVLDVVAYRVLVRPRLSAAMEVYWAARAVRPPGFEEALRTAGAAIVAMLERVWGKPGVALAGAGLLSGILLPGAPRVVSVALLGLVVEIALLSLGRPVAWEAVRVTLFLATVANVLAAATCVAVARRAWPRPWLRPAVGAGLALVVYGLATGRSWTALGRVQSAEDLGPLVRLVEGERGPEDGILLYARSRYVYAYYQSRTPVVVPNPSTTVGFHPQLDDPAVVVVSGANAPVAAARAFAGRRRVCLLGSRFVGGDERRITAALAAHGRRTRVLRHARALLVCVER